MINANHTTSLVVLVPVLKLTEDFVINPVL